MAVETSSFLYFSFTLRHNFRFLHYLELINLSVMSLDKKDLYLTLKFRMVTNTQIKAFFVHLNYNKKTSLRLLRYERVYLPLYKVADTPFHI